LGEDHYFTLHVWGDIGNTLWVSGRFAEAEDVLWQVKHAYERIGLDTSYDAVWLRSRIAALLKEQGRLAEAERYATEGVEGMRRLYGDDHWKTHYMLAYLGLVLMEQGRLAEAEPLILAEVETFREQLGDRSRWTHFAIQDLGILLYLQGRYPEAEALLQEGVDVYRSRQHGEHELYTYVYYHYLAQVIQAQGRLSEAESYYRTALDGIIETMGEDNQKVPRVRSGLAQVLIDLGRYPEADSMLNLAIDEYGRLGMQDSQEALLTLTRLAELRARRMRLDEAEDLLRVVLDTATDAFGRDHPLVVRNLNSLAFAKVAENHFTEAEKLWIEAAERFEAVRLRTSQEGLLRVSYAIKKSPLAPLAACLAHNDKPIRAWECYEAGLARGLFDALSARRFRPLSAEERSREIELTARLNKTEEQIGAFINTESVSEKRKVFRDLRLAQQKLKAELVAFQAEISEKYGVASGECFDLSRIQAQLPAYTAIIGWVDVEHPIRREDFSEHWGCIVRSHGDPVWVKLQGTGDSNVWTDADRELAGVLRDTLSRQPVDVEANDATRPYHRLFVQRLAPLESYLSDVSRLVVLPAGQMAGIPIEALTDNYVISYAPSATMYAWIKEGRGSRDEGPYFAKPTASADGLRRPRATSGRRGADEESRSLLAVGDPVFEETAGNDTTFSESRKSTPVLGMIVRGGNDPNPPMPPQELDSDLSSPPGEETLSPELRLNFAFERTRSSSFAPLPGTRLEVQAIAKLFATEGKYGAPTILLGAEASERRLDELAMSGDLGKYHRIHLATHAIMDDQVAMRSALILSHDTAQFTTEQLLSGKGIYDGKLTAEQIVRTWKVDADLVTLSGCETALGKESGGEGFLGFSQALFVAGARSLLLSLWDVEDRATMLLMTRFYENILGKYEEPRHVSNTDYTPGTPLPKAEALREAKEWLRTLTWDDVADLVAELGGGQTRGEGSEQVVIVNGDSDYPYEHPHYWAAFILMGDPD
jgi:tetratricopeptide (TPR) repeat protein